MTTRKIHSLCIGASALFAFSLTAKADTQFSEHFIYDAGANLNGQNGGTGFSAPWVQGGSDLDQVVAGNLTYPNYPSTGNSVLQSPPQDFQSSPFREINTIAGSPPNSPLYVSYLVKKISGVPAAPTPAEDYFGLVLYGPPGQDFGLFIGDPSESPNFALGTAGLASVGAEISDDLVTGNTALLIARIQFGQGNNDSVDLFVNPDLTQPLGTPDATKSGFTLQNIQAIGFVGGYGTYQYDEIRSGTSLEDLLTPESIPTPDSPIGAAWVLLPCFASALMRYRARKS